MKRCSLCRNEKSLSEFDRDRSRADGHTYVCKQCRHPRRAPGPSKPERQRMRAIGLAWCRGCEAWRPAGTVSRQGACRVHHAAEDRTRYAADASYRAGRRQHAHARRRGVTPIPSEAQELRLEVFHGECAYCPNPASTWDHVVPVARGGESGPDNVVPACLPCNSSKKDSDLEEWLNRTGRVIDPLKYERILFYQQGW